MFTEREMVEMLRSAGMANVRTYGSLQQEAFTPESKRLIVVCEKGSEQ